MSTLIDEGIDENKYRLISVERAIAPTGLPTVVWYRYVIARGRSIIEGLKPGTLQAVTEHAQNEVEGLNERTGRIGVAYVSRKPKKTAETPQGGSVNG